MAQDQDSARRDRESVLRKIDEATEPSKMEKHNALDWIEELISELEMRCEALREELKTEGG